MAKLHDKNICVLGTFMLELEGGTKESLQYLPDLIADAKIDVPRFAILTPYPNTPIFRDFEEQNRILTKDWSKYDSIHCVFQPANMTAQELESEFLRGLSNKDFCVLLYDESGQLKGFSTQRVLRVPVHGKDTYGIFSGDTLWLFENHPLQKVFSSMRNIRYESRLYTVDFGDAPILGESPIMLESGLL